MSVGTSYLGSWFKPYAESSLTFAADNSLQYPKACQRASPYSPENSSKGQRIALHTKDRWIHPSEMMGACDSDKIRKTASKRHQDYVNYCKHMIRKYKMQRQRNQLDISDGYPIRMQSYNTYSLKETILIRETLKRHLGRNNRLVLKFEKIHIPTSNPSK